MSIRNLSPVFLLVGIIYKGSFVQGKNYTFPEVKVTSVENINGHKEKLQIHFPNSSVISFKVNNSTSPLIKVVLECSYSKPTTWHFECPDPVPSKAITISKEIKAGNKINEFNFISVLSIDDTQQGDILLNASCRSSENIGISTAAIFHLGTSTFQANIVQNHVLRRWPKDKQNCQKPENFSTCPITLTVDLISATYSCKKNKGDGKSLSAYNFENCKDRLNLCQLLDRTSNKSCLSVEKRGRTLENPMQKHNISLLGPGIIFCNYNSGEFTLHYAYQFVLPSNVSDPQIQRVYTRKNESVTLITNARIIPLSSVYEFDGANATFACEALSWVFATGGEMYFVSANNEATLIDAFGNETLKNDDWFRKEVTVKIQKNITKMVCKLAILDSIDWHNIEFPLSVKSSSKVEIVGETKNSTKGSRLICNATGVPPPKVTWYCSTTVLIPLPPKGRNKIANSILVSDCPGLLESNYSIYCNASNGITHAGHLFTPLTAELPKTGTQTQLTTTIAITVSASVIVVAVAVIIVFYFRRKQKWNNLSDEEYEMFYKGYRNLQPSDALGSALLLAYDVRFEVDRSDIVLEETVLGSGQFGIVIQGRYRGEIVAVKTVRPTTDVNYFKALLAELKVLQYLGHHPNIVNIIGASTKNIRKMEVLLVLDFCENGNMVKFLRSCRGSFIDLYDLSEEGPRTQLYENSVINKLTTVDLLRMSVEIADAMSFIAEKQILHGDLAARNVLITGDKTTKICDFGLAKQLFEYAVYVQRQECPLPLRWMAIESLRDMEFSIESDVWAYGVLLYEIFTLAELPYPGVNWGFDSWRMLQDGYRLEQPQHASNLIYEIMKKCWHIEPQERPSFKSLHDALQDLRDDFRTYQ